MRLLCAAALGVFALLAVGVREAAAAPSASLNPTAGCDLAVINDWADNNRVDKIYAIPCYTQAIQRLNSYSDLKGYSSAEDDIRNALLAAIRQDRGSGGPTSTNGGGQSPAGPSSDGGSGNSGKGFVTRFADRLGPGNAQSIPLPLLVLGGLALLLLLSAAGTWIARRVQARRMTPAPAPARRP
ncbi:MAG: hypothetical protein ABI990_12030 [Actinomycetota bacterium]